jgi:hypothetical protein
MGLRQYIDRTWADRQYVAWLLLPICDTNVVLIILNTGRNRDWDKTQSSGEVKELMVW